MYDFHYNHVKVKYPHTDQLRLLFTVQTENIYEDMESDAATKYYFSKYPINHPLYDTSNRKAIGFFKDELNSVPMMRWIQCISVYRKVDRNIVQHSRPVVSSTAHAVCTVHQRKVGLQHSIPKDGCVRIQSTHILMVIEILWMIQKL